MINEVSTSGVDFSTFMRDAKPAKGYRSIEKSNQ